MSLKNIKKGITNVVGSAINAATPSTIRSNSIRKQADKDFTVLKRANSYKGAPDYDNNNMPTDAYKARSLATDVKTRLKRGTSDGFMSR